MKLTLDIATRQWIGRVIEENLDYLVRFAVIRVGHTADAEDIVHEAVRRMLEADLSKISKESIRMYLFRIVYNLCLDFHLKGQSIRPLAFKDDEIPDLSWEEELDLEEIERLTGLLERLPLREAEIIRMNVMDELSFVEISQIISTPVSTVKSRYKSGMEKLRIQYQKQR